VATGAALVAALILLVLLSPSASARVAHNPCPNNFSSFVDLQTGQFYYHASQVPERHRILRCDSAYRARGWETNEVARPTCPHPYKLAGTSLNHRQPGTAHWDFWVENGEWVTWTGAGGFTGETSVPGGTQVGGFNPHLHNWKFPGVGSFAGKMEGDMAVQGFAFCDEYGSRPEPDGGSRPDVETATPVATAGRRDGGHGDSSMTGTPGDDELRGHAGDDEESGGAGDDLLLGGAGNDSASGGRGDDELFDNHGHDHLWGGRGDDHFSTHDGNTDHIHCGPGNDIVYADPHDVVAPDCEHAHVIGRVPGER